jgi:hypothetical protein
VLYIEPRKEEKSAEPIDDELTAKVEAAFAQAISGAANYSRFVEPEEFDPGNGWRGWPKAEPGVNSDHYYLLPNGLITTVPFPALSQVR